MGGVGGGVWVGGGVECGEGRRCEVCGVWVGGGGGGGWGGRGGGGGAEPRSGWYLGGAESGRAGVGGAGGRVQVLCGGEGGLVLGQGRQAAGAAGTRLQAAKHV